MGRALAQATATDDRRKGHKHAESSDSASDFSKMSGRGGSTDTGSSEGESSSDSDDGLGSAADHPLANVPLGERLDFVADGHRLPRRRKQDKARAGSSRSPSGRAVEQEGPAAAAAPTKRASKHAPVVEPISRRPVSVVRDSNQRRMVHAVDPRFTASAMGGTADTAIRRAPQKVYCVCFPRQLVRSLEVLAVHLRR
jgi:hypothetical protein